MSPMKVSVINDGPRHVLSVGGREGELCKQREVVRGDKRVRAAHNLVGLEPLLILQAHHPVQAEVLVREEHIVYDAFEVKSVDAHTKT